LGFGLQILFVFVFHDSQQVEKRLPEGVGKLGDDVEESGEEATNHTY
jgi:hypothetical protein